MHLLHSSFVSKIDEHARHASEASARERALALLVNKSPAAFIFIRKIDDLQREIKNEKVEGL